MNYREFRRSVEEREANSDSFESIMNDSGKDYTMVPLSEWDYDPDEDEEEDHD